MQFAIFGIVLLAVVFGPRLWVWAVMRWYHEEIPGMPGTGGELAEHLVREHGLTDVTVEMTPDRGDHYDPSSKTVRLSPENYERKSLTAVAIAAHEVGHAMQHHQGDVNLTRRTQLAPVVHKIGQASVLAVSLSPVIGLVTRHPAPFSLLLVLGLSGLLARVALHVFTLPTEWDASFGKALPTLVKGQYIAPGEERAVARVLRAAALTYVAAALADVLNIGRWAMILLRR